jgi:hypothetical protein
MGYRGGADRSVRVQKREWREGVILSRGLDGAVDVHFLLDFRNRGDTTFSGIAFLVYSICHLKFFFDVTINGVGRTRPIAAGRTPRA